MPTITLASRLLPDQCVYWANITMFPCFPRPHSVTGLTQVAQPMSMVLMVLTLPASSASSPYLPTSHPSLWVFVCHLYLSGILHALLFAGNLLLRFRSGILSSRKIYAITNTHSIPYSNTGQNPFLGSHSTLSRPLLQNRPAFTDKPILLSQ